MNCEETLALLDAYFDNELDLTKTLAIEEHLRDCASCRSQYELRVALRQRLKDPDLRYTIPGDFADQVRKRLAVSSRPARRFVSLYRLGSCRDCCRCDLWSVSVCKYSTDASHWTSINGDRSRIRSHSLAYRLASGRCRIERPAYRQTLVCRQTRFLTTGARLR
jgi:anti-sigma factor RsiW